jgi:hypothetical protein
MCKGYTKQEVQQWQDWSNKKTDQVAKDGETYEYELSLRLEVDEFIVDCREDIVKDDDVVSSEYEEGFIFDNYSEAEKKLKEIEVRLEKQNKKIFITNEVKTLHNVLGREIKPKEEEPTLWTVDLNTIFKNILFKCTEDELEQNVQEFVISEIDNLDWTYEKADVNVNKTMIRS